MSALSAQEIMAAADRRRMEASTEEALQGRIFSALWTQSEDFEEQVSKLRNRVRSRRGGADVVPSERAEEVDVPQSIKVPKLSMGTTLQDAAWRPFDGRESDEHAPSPAPDHSGRCASCNGLGGVVGVAMTGFAELVCDVLELALSSCTPDRPEGARGDRPPSAWTCSTNPSGCSTNPSGYSLEPSPGVAMRRTPFDTLPLDVQDAPQTASQSSLCLERIDSFYDGPTVSDAKEPGA